MKPQSLLSAATILLFIFWPLMEAGGENDLTISDNGWSYRLLEGVDNTGTYDTAFLSKWTTPLNRNLLYQLSWYIGDGTSLIPLYQFDQVGFTTNGNTGTITYQSNAATTPQFGNALEVTLSYTCSGSGSYSGSLEVDYVVKNISSQVRTLKWFSYHDAEGFNEAEYLPASNRILYGYSVDPNFELSVDSIETPDHWEIGQFATLQSRLELDGLDLDLSDEIKEEGPNDKTSAFQWDLNLAPGATATGRISIGVTIPTSFNTAPVARNDTYYNVDPSTTGMAFTVLGNDSAGQTGDTILIVAISPEDEGLEIAPDGSFAIFTAPVGLTTKNYTYTIRDTFGVEATATASFRTSDPPTPDPYPEWANGYGLTQFYTALKSTNQCTTYEWRDISYSGTPLALEDDDCTGAIPIGFSFPYYGTVKSNVYIGSNGFINLNNPYTATQGSVSTTSPSAGLIALFWRDLNPLGGEAGSIWYQSNPEEFVVTYEGVPFYEDSSSTVTAQVILKSNGDIILQYKEVPDPNANVGVNGTLVSHFDGALIPKMAILLKRGNYYKDQDPDADGDTNQTEFENGTDPISAAPPTIHLDGNGKCISAGDTFPGIADYTKFEPTYIGTSVTRSYTIHNLGEGVLNLASVTSSNPVFSISSNPSSTVPRFGSTDLTIAYTPTSEGADSSMISISSNDPSTPSFLFLVAGGANSSLNVSGNGNVIINGDQFPQTDNGTDWGIVDFNGQRANMFTISNNGLSPVSIGQINSTHDSFSGQIFTSSIAPGSTHYFLISYQAAYSGLIATTISIEDSNGSVLYSFGIQLDTMSHLESWRSNFLGSRESEGDAHDLFDADGDGMINLMEYAIGGNPTFADFWRLPSLQITNDGSRKFSFSRFAASTELNYIVETTNDFQLWTALGQSTGGNTFITNGSVSATEVTNGSFLDCILIDSSAASSAEGQFYRLRVERP